MIYHITTPAVWAEAQNTGQVVAESLITEGFIHCSRERQLLAVANRFFPGVKGLLVLGIDEEGVEPWLVNEGPVGVRDPFAHDLFPHIYGPIPIAAIVAATALEVDSDGSFVWPMALPRV